MATRFLPSEIGDPAESPTPYTGNPFLLCWLDIALFFKNFRSVLGILVPWSEWHCKELDELYPSPQNLITIAIHGVLIIVQIIFVVSLPLVAFLPLWVVIVYVGAVMALTGAISWTLNGSEDYFESQTDLGDDKRRFEHECWLFMNGVSVG
jgi:hypothetical protein